MVSIIIPVFNGILTIPRLLESLLVQTYPSIQIEIIIIDNASTDSTGDLVRRWGNHIRLLQFAKRGSYAARNLGIKAAKGEILVFTDADCIADKYWIATGVNCLMEGGVGIVGGDIRLLSRDIPSLVELYEIQTAFQQEKYVKKRQFAATANLFVHRRVFENNGLFEDSLKSGGDRVFCNRAVKNGESILFCKDAVIYHEARRTFAELVKKQFRIGVGWGRMPSARQPDQGSQNYLSRSPYSIANTLPLSRIIQLKILSFCILLVFNIAYRVGCFLRLLHRLQVKQKVLQNET